MSSLKAQILLGKVSLLYEEKKFAIPKDKIKEKIEHLKLLSTQKKIPKLTLRKTILHLEDQLHSIYDIEKALLKQKRKESTKVTSLKRQIKILRKTASVERARELEKRVDKLSHLLGEALAKQSSRVAVSAAREQISKRPASQERRLISHPKFVPVIRAPERGFQQSGAPNQIGKVAPASPVKNEEREKKIMMLQQRLNMLKQEFAIKEHQEVHPEELKKIQQMIKLFEDKLKTLGVARTKPKHTMLINMPLKERMQVEKGLPLPPPQKKAV